MTDLGEIKLSKQNEIEHRCRRNVILNKNMVCNRPSSSSKKT